MDLSGTWSIATVLEPTSYTGNLETTGAFVITPGKPFILSLNPGEDFELNTDLIQQWKVIFQTSKGETLGDADYANVLKNLKPYILDQQNGSVLIQTLTDEDLNKILSEAKASCR